MKIAWHLCEIFYWTISVADLTHTVIAHLVLEWARDSLDPLASDNSHHPSSLEYFWSYVQRLLIRGDISQAIRELNASTQTEAHWIATLLHKMPDLYAIQGTALYCSFFCLPNAELSYRGHWRGAIPPSSCPMERRM